MAVLRNRRTRRLLALVFVVLSVVGAWLALRSRTDPYRAGEVTDGLTDALGRRLPEDAPALSFTDVTAAAGLACGHFEGQRAGLLSEDMGSGVALGDVDGDGWCDALVMTIEGDAPAPPRLFQNRGDGTFADVTERAGLASVGIGMAAAFCDTDSDGDLDLALSSVGGLHLLRNDGGWAFTDITDEAGLSAFTGFFAGIAVGDADGDGGVDLYVCRYVVFDEHAADGGLLSQFGVDIPMLLNPSVFEPAPNLLLRNLGGNRFEDVAEAAGVADPGGRGLGAMFCDLNADGLPDLYVANDVSDNALFLNEGDGTFGDRTNDALVGDYRGAMGLAAGDFDEDGDLDFLVTHWIAQENGLYVNHTPADTARGGAPLFMDSADRFGLGHVALDRVGWATGFVDFDLDGRLDLFVVNGSTIPVEGRAHELAPMASQMFWNAGAKRGFFEFGRTAGTFFGEEHVGRGGAVFDYDGDGDEDLLVLLYGEGVRLLRNDTPTGGSVRLRLRQAEGNRFALGTRITAEVGGRTLVRMSDTQGSYLSQHAVGETTIGLGGAREVERVTLRWPDGSSGEAGPFSAGSVVTWVKGAPALVDRRGAAPAGEEREALTVPEQRVFYDLQRRARRARVEARDEDAVRLYREALAMWPDHADSLYYLGSCLLELGDEPAALEVFGRLTAARPDSSRGFMRIGTIRLPGGDAGLDDLALAQQAFERSHRINGEESLPVLQLGLVALLRGELERAADLLARASVGNPRDPQAPYFGGRAAWLAGDRARAQALLEEAHATATGGERDASVSSEGDTAGGEPLVARPAARGAGALERWRGLTEREPLAEVEYAWPPD
ncbi:MAG: hypothetical protein CMJ84_15160 [Planctomycetes bacterium]|nr:hypothetical protein [Planctomycetota bacterium]